MNKKLLVAATLLVLGVGVGYKFFSSPAGNGQAARVGDATKVQLPSISPGGVAQVNASSSAATKDAAVAANPNVAYDPRLANLVVTTDNPTIEYVRGEGGLVIAELDNDPNNISYKKPLKEYQYRQGKVQTMTRYEYFKTEIIVTTIDVAYKPDGSVYDYREQTSTRKIGQ
jgi:hypothetical protein